MTRNLPDIISTAVPVMPTTGAYESDLAWFDKITQADQALQWIIGDSVNTMRERWEGTQRTLIQDISERTNRTPVKTLEKYALVARTYSMDQRGSNLSYSHYRAAVVSDSPHEIVVKAEEQGLSVRDTERLAKGLPLGGEDVATKESSAPAAGTNLEESALLDIETATAHLNRALATINKQGFRLTAPVGQDIMVKLEALSKPFVSIEAAVEAEVGSLR